MLDHFQHIYQTRAADYARLVAAEDITPLLEALARLRPLAAAHVVEAGAGTGRVTRMLAPHVASLLACEGSAHMLAEAVRTPTAGRVHFAVASNHALPAPNACADLALEGWSFAHAVAWYPDTWRTEIAQMIGELARVLRPGGTLALIETLGTGAHIPAPPNPGLAACYAWFTDTLGFQQTWVRTDIHFADLAEARALTGFFFGADFAAGLSAPDIPECTGIWWKTV